MTQNEVKKIFLNEFYNDLQTVDVFNLHGVSTESIERTAYHEAGHYFAADMLGAWDIKFAGGPKNASTQYTIKESDYTEFYISLAGNFAQYKFYHKLKDKKIIQAIADLVQIFFFFQSNDGEKCDAEYMIEDVFRIMKQNGTEDLNFFADLFACGFLLLDGIFSDNKRKYMAVVEKAKKFYGCK